MQRSSSMGFLSQTGLFLGGFLLATPVPGGPAGPDAADDLQTWPRVAATGADYGFGFNEKRGKSKMMGVHLPDAFAFINGEQTRMELTFHEGPNG